MAKFTEAKSYPKAAALDFIQLQLLNKLRLSNPQMKLAASSLKGAIKNGLSLEERQIQLQRLLDFYEAELLDALSLISSLKAVQDQKDSK